MGNGVSVLGVLGCGSTWAMLLRVLEKGMTD